MKKYVPIDSEETREKFVDRVVQDLTDSGEFSSMDARHNVAAKWWENNELSKDEASHPETIQHTKMIIDRLEKDAGSDDAQPKATFIASTATSDRHGDTIDQAGWELDAFRDNPVLLFGHDSSALPVGKVDAIEVKGGNLVAHTIGVEAGVHDMADKVWKMVSTGFLNAVSVGFRALAHEPRFDDEGNWLGYNFLRQELMELSIVPVPANPEAILVARSYGASREDISKMFGDSENLVDAFVAHELRRAELEILKLRGSGVSVH